MSNEYVTDCDYCGFISSCVCDPWGGTACRSCLDRIMADERPEPEPPTDEQLEAQYQDHLDNPFGYEQIDPEQYLAPPEQEFDDYDTYVQCEEYYDDSMDGDHASGLASAGWGTDEDYNYPGDGVDIWDDF